MENKMQIKESRLKNLLKFCGISNKEVNGFLKMGSDYNNYFRKYNELPKNVENKLIMYLENRVQNLNKAYLFGTESNMFADRSSQPKLKVVKERKKREVEMERKTIRTNFNTHGNTDLSIDQPETYAVNNCNQKVVNERIKELGWMKKVLNYWFSEVNIALLNNYLCKNNKSIKKNHQRALAYFCKSSISELATGYKNHKIEYEASFVDTDTCKYVFNDNFIKLIDQNSDILVGLKIPMFVIIDSLNRKVSYPEEAAKYVASVVSKNMGKEYSVEDIFTEGKVIDVCYSNLSSFTDKPVSKISKLKDVKETSDVKSTDILNTFLEDIPGIDDEEVDLKETSFVNKEDVSFDIEKFKEATNNLTVQQLRSIANYVTSIADAKENESILNKQFSM